MARRDPIAIGIDVGGTWTRVAAVNEHGQVLAVRRGPTSRFHGGDRLVRGLAASIGEVIEESAPPGTARVPAMTPIGLALPGLVDRDAGVLVRSVNLPQWEGSHLVEELESATAFRVDLFCDAEAATWAEYLACTPHPDRFAHLRIGTGVACGFVEGGRLIDLQSGRDDHLKFLVIDDNAWATRCRCGLRGCLETVASGPALEHRAEALGFAGGLNRLYGSWIDKNDDAVRLLGQTAEALAQAILKITSELRPEVITIGGGVASALPCLPELVQAEFARRITARKTPIITAAVRGDDAGVIGAALLAWEHSGTPTPRPRSRTNDRVDPAPGRRCS